jgi:hypothetical protein
LVQISPTARRNTISKAKPFPRILPASTTGFCVSMAYFSL